MLVTIILARNAEHRVGPQSPQDEDSTLNRFNAMHSLDTAQLGLLACLAIRLSALRVRSLAFPASADTQGGTGEKQAYELANKLREVSNDGLVIYSSPSYRALSAWTSLQTELLLIVHAKPLANLSLNS